MHGFLFFLQQDKSLGQNFPQEVTRWQHNHTVAIHYVFYFHYLTSYDALS